MAEKLVTIAQYADSIEANLAKQVLADYGVEATLDGEYTTNIYSLPSVAIINLQVLESHANQAVEILESTKRMIQQGEQQLEELEEDWDDDGGIDDGICEEPES